MRINLKLCLATLCFVVALVTLISSYWTKCSIHSSVSTTSRLEEERRDSDLWGDIDCQVNGDFTIGCKRNGKEIYVPFSFIHKYFEVSGKLAKSDGTERFEWSQCTSKVFTPKVKYDPRGVFAYFENYKVEDRDRVKCISGSEGVPVTTQWDPKGYYYPTQIAQYGLSHYSKNLTQPEPKRRVIEDGDNKQANWNVPSEGGYAGRQYNPRVNDYVLNFYTAEGSTIDLLLEPGSEFVLSVTLSILSNSSLSVSMLNIDSGDTWRIHYVCSRELITSQDRDIYYGIGCLSTWQSLTRDLLNDVQKGVQLKATKRKLKFKVTHIHLYGSGSIDNLTLSTSEHMAQFYATAHWLVNHQNASTGGWSTPVTRHIAADIPDIKPGWYSAMGQGHALSVLSRAYHHSGGNPIYLNTALRALKPFHVDSSRGGVLARFMDKFPWYEEYPTTPPIFILNGFIYSLMGLYDLLTLAPHSKQKDARLLYEQGISSLKKLLPIYDTGSGTFYDLRHISLGIAPKIARCDYHATHVNQLLLLASFEQDPVIANTAQRWLGYLQGKRASHN